MNFCYNSTNHTHTHMFKGDSESQWENGKFDTLWPRNPEPIVTKIVTGDYVRSICAKFGPDRIGVFCPPPHICEVAHESDSATYFWGFDNFLPPRRLHRFWRSVRQTTSFRARVCLLGVPKTDVYVFTPFFQKRRFAGIFDEIYQIFR